MSNRLMIAGLQRRPLVVDVSLLLAFPIALAAPEWLGWLKTDPRLLMSGLAVGLRGGLFASSPGFLDPNSAWTLQSLGHLAAEQWLAGLVPWWNPLSGVGAPLAAEMQPAALFLPFVLLLHFAWGWLALHLCMQAIAAIGTWALLRRLGLSRAVCLLGGVLYAASGTFAWFSHGPERAASFLPWMVYAVELCRAERRGSGLLGLSVAGAIYAGWPETAYLDGLLVAVWVLARLAVGGAWGRLVGRLAAGLALGAALGAPAWWPFALYARDADLGGHGAMARLALSGPGMAMLLLPYVNGPLVGMQAAMREIWGSVGSYVGVLPVVLGFAGLAGRREAALRWALAGWLVFLALRTAGWGPAIQAARLIPFVGAIELPRYIGASLGFGCVVLACFAIDDWRRAETRYLGELAIAIGAWCVAAAIWADWPMAAVLWPQPLYRSCLVASAGAAGAGIGLIGWALGRAPGRRATALVLAVMALESVGYYAAGRLGAPRAGHLQTRPVRVLGQIAGLGRVISGAGGIGLNENAQDGFASVDETMLPVPRLWADYVRGTLHGDPIELTHARPTMDWLGRDWPALRDLGVAWLITPNGAGPANALATRPANGARIPVPLAPGGTMAGTLASGLPGAGPVDAVGVDIGTYGGRSDGVLTFTLRGGFGVSRGSAAVAGAADNAALTIKLDRPVPAGARVDWTMSSAGARVPVAIWAGGVPAVPRFSTAASFAGGWRPELVYGGDGKEIYRLPGAAPYWETPCRTGGATREVAVFSCAAPASVLRRELFFAGWRASVNGAPVVITRDGLFQRIALPAGVARARFSYAPPGIGWAALAFWIGLCMSLGCLGARGGRV